MSILTYSDRLGKSVINLFENLGGYISVYKRSFGNLPMLFHSPVRSVLYRQIYFTGLESFSKLSIIGLFIGIVIITQVSNLVGLNSEMTGKILVWVVVRELGPLLAAMIIIARSSPAIASELGVMRINGEMTSLILMGIDPDSYLILPRIIGISVSVMIVTFYFQLVAIFGAVILSSIIKDIAFLKLLNNVADALSIFELFVSLFKSLIFGIIISVVPCYHGLKVQSSLTEVPRAASTSVMQSLFLIFFFDGLINVISFI